MLLPNLKERTTTINLEPALQEEIRRYALLNNIEKVILFGSRARDTNSDRSDVDLAVSGGNPRRFHTDLEERARTLLFFDVVDLNKPHLSPELLKEIEKDGVTIYEKI